MVLAAALAGGLWLPGTARAAEEDGVIVDVDGPARAFTVRSAAPERPQVRTFRTTDETRITFGRKRVPFGNLVMGGRVSVRYRPDPLGPIATAVTIHRLKRR
jgi:hypothetical protein